MTHIGQTLKFNDYQISFKWVNLFVGHPVVSTSCLVGVWTYLDCVWTMSRLYLEHKTCLESVWNCLECVWICLEHVWPVSRLCLEHVHTFCGPCPEHVWTETWPWCRCLDHGLCMFCMDQFGPCLNRVLTLLWPCMDCVWISSIQCRNVPLRCLKPVRTLSKSQTVSPPTSLGAKIHLGKCIH